MPLTVPAGLLTKANFVLAYLKPLVDATETNADTALTTAQAANTLAGQKYTKPASGIPVTDLASGAVGVVVRRYVNSAWEVRGTTATNLTVLWIKTASTDPDPPINATYFLQGTDLLFKPA